MNVAVYVAGVAGVTMACERAPPSDHDEKVQRFPVESVWSGALTVTAQFRHDTNVDGAVKLFTSSARPDGFVASVTSTFAGWMFIETVFDNPRESVAVRKTSR